MKALIIGRGEVGSALARILAGAHEVVVYDRLDGPVPGWTGIDVLNIAFSWSEKFIDWVAAYQHWSVPRLTIVHSTVPVGTTRQLGPDTAHSPVNGVHPHLEEGLRTFPKWIGGPLAAGVMAGDFLSAAGFRCTAAGESEVTEAAKLWCTAQYAWNIILAKEISEWCREQGLAFSSVYRLWNEMYNHGYETLGMPYVRRPILDGSPGLIGGHCLIPNARMLDTWLTRTILYRNRTYEEKP